MTANASLREGFTTGSCAAAAALASCLWRRDGVCPAAVEITLPGGQVFRPDIVPYNDYTCGVVKDAGDDPDITNGSMVTARVDIREDGYGVRYIAGDGVGTITKPGLKLAVGEAAVNPVPRRMIEEAIASVYPRHGADVRISIPGGQALAAKTYNPRLGVVGGLSILGTTGIVRPMSEDALTRTISLELGQKRALWADGSAGSTVALVFGNQGEDALSRLYPSIKTAHIKTAQISNYVGFALDECARLGFGDILIAGHPGKLAKVAAGIMQTSSRYGDGRREGIITQLALMGAGCELCRKVYDCVTTDAMIDIIRGTPYERVWDDMARVASAYCMARIRHAARVEALFMDGKGQPLGDSMGSTEAFNRWVNGFITR